MSKKNKIRLIVSVLFLVALPAIIYLVQHPQIFKGRAVGGAIEVFGSNIIDLPNGKKAFTLNSQGQPVVNLRLTSPLGPATTGTANGSVTSSSAVSLSLSPASGTQPVGGSFDVSVSLNAGSNNISFVDITISFDKNLLSMDPFIASPAFNTIVVNGPVDSSAGTYRFTAGNNSTRVVTGNINMGTAHFQAKSVGTALIGVSAKEVTIGGANPVDIQTATGNGSYTITSTK